MYILDTVGPIKLPIRLQSAEGALMWDQDGKTYWDFYGEDLTQWMDSGRLSLEQVADYLGVKAKSVAGLERFALQKAVTA